MKPFQFSQKNRRPASGFGIITLICIILLYAGCKGNRSSGDSNDKTKLTVESIVDKVSQEKYMEFHKDIENMGLGLYGGPEFDMGYRNRDGWEGIGTKGNQEARKYIIDVFTELGLDVTVQGSFLNVVGELKGNKTPGNIFIIGAHYDHLEGDMPGGDDNASGTAGVLEAARVLSRYSFESTIRFVCFNAEEDSQTGSKDYVKSHIIPNDENIVGMINLDMILRPGSDANPETKIDAELETQYKHPQSLEWASSFQVAAKEYVPGLTVNDTIIDTESTSDNDAFLNNAYPAFLVIENSLPDFWDANLYYHGFEDATDRLANDPESPSGVTYNFAFAADVTRAALALLASKAVPVGQNTEYIEK